MGKLRAALSFAALTLAANAHAGSGTTPSKIEAGLISVQHGIVEARVFPVNGALVAVLENDANAAGNPEGISLIRGANHKIARPAAGKQLELIRAVADGSGNVFIVYSSPTEQFGLRPITRRIKPDNTLGFEKTLNVERFAGVAPTGDGGLYLGSHVPYNVPGEFVTTMTHHRTYKLSPSGDVLWQVEAAGQKQPTGASQYASTAAANGDGVFLGYGIGDGGGDFGLVPVIGHRQASDGAELFTRVGLKKPAGAAAVALPPGTVGTVAIDGLVDEIVIGSDGTAIAAVDAKSNEQFIVRVDASGNQTESFACSGAPERFANGELACVRLSPKLAVTRFGTADGHLKILSQWSIDPPAGTSHTAWAPLPAGKLLVAGAKDGKASLRMYSAAGALMTTWSSPTTGVIGELGAFGGNWIGYGAATPPDWTRFAGTYTVGGTTKPSAMPRGAMPKLPR